MRRAHASVLGLALALAPFAPRAAAGDDVPPERRAFVEITTPRETVYVGEPIVLRLRFGLDAAWFEAHAVPLFRQRMDLPVQVLAPAMAGLPGAVRRAAESEGATQPARRRFVLDDGPGLADDAADVDRDGRRFTVHEVEVGFVPTQPGPLVVPPPLLRFAYATRFERDFAQGRLPMDRTDVRVAGTSPSIRVLPLPEEGRPSGFSGAVGRFTMRAALDPSTPAAAQGVRVVLRIEGKGNLEVFATPSLAGLEGFHVYGALDDRGRPVRTVRYDLAPVRDGVDEVPAITLTTFDPGPPSTYRTVTTGAALRLSAPLRATVPARPEAPGTATDGDPEGRGGALGGARGALLAGAAVAILAALAYGVVRRRRARAAAAADPRGARLGAALKALHAGASGPTPAPSDAFAEVLAARLGCSAAAVIAPELAPRLREAGVAPDVAARAAAILERLVATRYGGAGAGEPPDDLVETAERVAGGRAADGRSAEGR